jgi:hypothetical protein
MYSRLLRKDRDPVGGAAGIALVDGALAWLSRRDFVTDKEAEKLFRDLRTNFGDPASSSIAEFLDGAIREYGNDGLWGAPTVADTLLDLRILLSDRQSVVSSK